MKKTCKSADIENGELVQHAVLACLRPAKKRGRSDTRKLFARVLNIKPREARAVLMERGPLYLEAVEKITAMLLEQIHARKLRLKPVVQDTRYDPRSRKTRKISLLSIEQLLFDHVAVVAMQDLSRRIGEYQVSSIPGRGAAYGKKAVEKWLRHSSCKYAVKLDIRDFYGSINRERLMAWLRERVQNPPLLWLIEQLIYTVPQGMAIGSYLSQTMANIYLSDLYHLAMERCISKRGKHQVLHALFYMDDMALFGTNRRQLRYAAFKLMERAGELGLQIKPHWHVFRVEHSRPLDMMGYRFSQYRTTLRKRVFKPARRALIRARRIIRRGGVISSRRAARLASYHGYFQDTNSHLFLRRIHGQHTFATSFSHVHCNIYTRAGARHDRETQRTYSHHCDSKRHTP